ncbi:hypothetical protein A7982_13814 [Minicystis rosea]|nr:hypothetical protein A7982_13814 [Minicystis rosea]
MKNAVPTRRITPSSRSPSRAERLLMILATRENSVKLAGEEHGACR